MEFDCASQAKVIDTFSGERLGCILAHTAFLFGSYRQDAVASFVKIARVSGAVCHIDRKEHPSIASKARGFKSATASLLLQPGATMDIATR
jgi:hypothetical protein